MDTQIRLYERGDDYARIEFYSRPNSPVDLSLRGRFQIAAKSYGSFGDPTKAINFWYGPGIAGSTGAKDILSMLHNSQIRLGATDWESGGDEWRHKNTDFWRRRFGFGIE